tara:strand:+ start:254 stop:949 length:696 start_codon:yes stop_codon:yes gene_type:complete
LFNRGQVLIIILGCFGDFDSIEYAQSLYRYLGECKRNRISLFILGIGNSKSKEIFSNYTGIPNEYIEYTEDNNIHIELKLINPQHYKLSPEINMLLMCCGLNSKGTLKEVIRGYTGSKYSSNIVSINNNYINNKYFKVNTSLFNFMIENNKLRPFELATIRLNNMIEIVLNWKLYIPDSKFLTQRGATFLYGNDQELKYKFFPKSLLIYSETMDLPLSYLDFNKEINSSLI